MSLTNSTDEQDMSVLWTHTVVPATKCTSTHVVWAFCTSHPQTLHVQCGIIREDPELMNSSIKIYDENFFLGMTQPDVCLASNGWIALTAVDVEGQIIVQTASIHATDGGYFVQWKIKTKAPAEGSKPHVHLSSNCYVTLLFSAKHTNTQYYQRGTLDTNSGLITWHSVWDDELISGSG